MPNHVSTLRGSSYKGDTNSARTAKPPRLPSRRNTSSSPGKPNSWPMANKLCQRWRARMLRSGIIWLLSRASPQLHMCAAFFSKTTSRGVQHQTTGPTRIKPVRSQSFSAPQLHVVPNAKQFRNPLAVCNTTSRILWRRMPQRPITSSNLFNLPFNPQMILSHTTQISWAANPAALQHSTASTMFNIDH